MTKNRNWLARVLAAAGLWVALSLGAGAAELDQTTRTALQSVITQQLDAFRRDDATAAQSFAAPGIKSKFPNAADFLALVQRAYAPLIRPRSTHFDATDTDSLGTAQKMTVVDSQGEVWTALYTFEQVDGQWKITGCVLLKEQSTTI